MFEGVMHFFRPVVEVLFELVRHYGLAGLFASSLIGSTIFVPFSVEFAETILLAARENVLLVILTASVGALIGTWINYWIGYFGSELVEKRVGEKNIKKAKDFMDKYGWPGLFVIIFLPTPIPVDPVTVFPGLARMSFIEFSIVVFIAKLLRYSVVAALLTGFMGFTHF